MRAWELELVPRSGMLVGAVWDPATGAHLASAALPVPGGEPVALLPGSSLRGVLRDALARFAEARTREVCSRPAVCTCRACALFGSPDVPGKLRVASAQAPARWVSSASVAIDRITRTAWRAGHALWIERKAFAAFKVRVEAIRDLTAEELELLETFWAWLAAVGISIGQRRSAGAGSFKLRARHSNHSDPVLRQGVGGNGRRRRYALRIRLLEPAHVVGPRQRDFYRDALSVIPASTIRGALGQALAYMGRGYLAEQLFRSDPNHVVLVGPAFPVEPERRVGDAVPWLSRRRCRRDGHTIDLLAAHVAEALGGQSIPTTCPRCGAPLREAHAPPPTPLVLGHTAIDPRTRRAAEGQLHYEVALAPGTAFEAQLVARPDQAAILAELKEVLIGGRRARGMGGASVEIHEIPSPPLEERILSLAAEVKKRGAHDADNVAVLGLVSDAAVEPSLGEVLRRQGFDPLGGELRTVERGGWDELNGRPRALRKVLVAGSWVIVRCRQGRGWVAALDQLERSGLPDRDEISPLLVVVRGNEEVEEVVTTSQEEPTAGAERDELVRHVRELCRKHAGQLPERSQLHNLLRYAQQTASVEEVALFFEYQASRREFRKQAPFLKRLAEEARRKYAGNPEGLRAFLAVAVRAAHVERETRRREDRK